MKSILITGASSGIGAATARRFLEAGWRVGLLARRRAQLEKIAAGHPQAIILESDVTDPAAVEAAFKDFSRACGRIDVLLNNAGSFGRSALIDELDVDDWRSVVDVNLNGMFFAARAAFAQMRAQLPQGGRIINNGSISAHAPRPQSVGYTTTKHAITGLTKSLSLDGRAFDIACCQIDVGNARTELLEGIIANASEPPPAMDVALVADAVLHMAELPPEANMQFMTLMATKMPYIGRG